MNVVDRSALRELHCLNKKLDKEIFFLDILHYSFLMGLFLKTITLIKS